MKMFETMVRVYGKELIENLTVISRNLALKNSEKKMELLRALAALIVDLEDGLMALAEEKETLEKALRDLVGFLDNKPFSESDSNLILASFVLNKVANESVDQCQRMLFSLGLMDSETEAMRVVAKSWELNSTLEEISDCQKFNSVVDELGSVPMKQIRDEGELSERLNSELRSGLFAETLTTAQNKYNDLYSTMAHIHYRIYEEMVKAAENPSETLNMHHALNQMVGAVNMAEIRKIESEAITISQKLRKSIARIIENYESVNSDLLLPENVRLAGRLQPLIKERINEAKFMIGCLDRLDIMTDRSLKAIKNNLERVIKIKTSHKEMFNEVLEVLVHADIKKAS